MRAWWHGIKLSKVLVATKGISWTRNIYAIDSGPIQWRWTRKENNSTAGKGEMKEKNGSRQSRRVRGPTFHLTWSSVDRFPVSSYFFLLFLQPYGLVFMYRRAGSTLAGILSRVWPFLILVVSLHFLSLIQKKTEKLLSKGIAIIHWSVWNNHLRVENCCYTKIINYSLSNVLWKIIRVKCHIKCDNFSEVTFRIIKVMDTSRI